MNGYECTSSYIRSDPYIRNREIMPKTLKGTVVSNKMQKTLVVEVVRLAKHPKYKRYYKVSKRYKAHDDTDSRQAGDTVMIQETKPISRDKRWKVVPAAVARNERQGVSPVE